jgi:hypothetical protein
MQFFELQTFCLKKKTSGYQMVRLLSIWYPDDNYSGDPPTKYFAFIDAYFLMQNECITAF